MDLGEYLKAPRPAFDFVAHDCSRWMDRWIVSRGHASAMEATGIRYSSERSALRTIRRGGGLFALWQRGMDAIGVPEVATPTLGNCTILEIPTDDGVNETCGIWTGERWASLHRHGLMFGVGSPIMIWAV